MKTEKNLLAQTLDCLTLGKPRTCRNLTLFPLFGPEERPPEYLTLSEALDAGLVTVKEVSASGSVPNLMLVNPSDHYILLLDGEEVAGARQNRILNTSILAAPRSELVIPVSCTERGRWHYAGSTTFSSSKTIMTSTARRRKSESVRQSLMGIQKPVSDQAQVWQDIAELHLYTASHSPTDAMQDAFKQHQQTLQEFESAFPCEPGQRGMAALLNGAVCGVDYLSRAAAYAQYHPQLVRSHALEAIARPAQTEAPPAAAAVLDFFRVCGTLEETVHPSPGCGEDRRYHGPAASGAALVYEGNVIHALLFPAEQRPPRPSPRIHRHQ